MGLAFVLSFWILLQLLNYEMQVLRLRYASLRMTPFRRTDSCGTAEAVPLSKTSFEPLVTACSIS
jgi:hypothetical protein